MLGYDCLRPGHYINPGMSEVDGLKAILNDRLGPEDGVGDMDWEIGECLSTWWRPSFEQYMVYVGIMVVGSK